MYSGAARPRGRAQAPARRRRAGPGAAGAAGVRGAGHRRHAIRIRPEDYQSPLLVAQSFEDLGRPDEAQAVRRRGIRIAEEHLRLQPDDARALYMGANGLMTLLR